MADVEAQFIQIIFNYPALQVEELQAALAEERRRATKLQEALAARDADLLATEDKYKKCLEKAKDVIKSLDPRASGTFHYSVAITVQTIDPLIT